MHTIRQLRTMKCLHLNKPSKRWRSLQMGLLHRWIPVVSLKKRGVAYSMSLLALCGFHGRKEMVDLLLEEGAGNANFFHTQLYICKWTGYRWKIYVWRTMPQTHYKDKIFGFLCSLSIKLVINCFVNATTHPTPKNISNNIHASRDGKQLKKAAIIPQFIYLLVHT